MMSKSTQLPFEGIIAYPITPFNNNGQKVDSEKLKTIIKRMLEAGVHAIAPLGSTGVLPYLSDEEREQVVEITLSTVAKKVPILVGVSSLTTERTIYHAKFAEKAGATSIMVIPMSYWKLTEEEIYQHFKKINDAVDIPVMVYNNPATGGLDLSPELIVRLFKLPHVTMVKESTGDVQRMHRLMQLLDDSAAFYNGSNPLALAAFAAGAKGWCTAAANLIPHQNIALYDAIKANDLNQAQKLFYKQLPLLQFILKGGPRTIAAGLEILGVDAGELRGPLQPIAETEKAQLREILKNLEA
jgi:4-hydroxy-tetrahydrodipicolinate synthase